jgi:hypothetical protein
MVETAVGYLRCLTMGISMVGRVWMRCFDTKLLFSVRRGKCFFIFLVSLLPTISIYSLMLCIFALLRQYLPAITRK